MAELASSSSNSPIGRAVTESPLHGTPDADPFYEFLPCLIKSKYPEARPEELERVAGFVRFALGNRGVLEESIVNDSWRLVFLCFYLFVLSVLFWVVDWSLSCLDLCSRCWFHILHFLLLSSLVPP